MGRARRALAAGLLAGLLILVVCRTFAFQLHVVPTLSMAPSLLRGDWLLVNRLAFRTRPPARGDVIVFQAHGQSYVKRVLGLPGDRISFRDGVAVVNGAPLSPGPVEEVGLDDCGAIVRRPVQIATHARFEESIAGRTWPIVVFRQIDPPPAVTVVMPDHLFVAGDNRSDSVDSRSPTFGSVPFDAIEGQVTHIVWSRNERGFRSGRWWMRAL